MLTILGGTLLFRKLIELQSRNGPTLFTTVMQYNITFMYIITNISLIVVALADPGVVTLSGLKDDNLVVDVESNEADERISFTQARHMNKKAHDRNKPKVPYSYCDICEVYQIKSKGVQHCHDCDVCIEELDHHCPWMGKCVGKKNMTVFMVFNACWVLFMVEMLGCVLLGS